MTDILELKEWLKIDGSDEDSTLNSLLISSNFIIEQATGVTEVDLEGNEEATELYKLVQKLIITDLYENRDGSSKLNQTLIGLCTKLEAYKLKG